MSTTTVSHCRPDIARELTHRRQARPNRSTQQWIDRLLCFAPRWAAQGHWCRTLLRRIPHRQHVVRFHRLQHHRRRPNHPSGYSRRRIRARRCSRHDVPKRATSEGHAHLLLRAQSRRPPHGCSASRRNHPLERRTHRGRTGRDPGTGRLCEVTHSRHLLRETRRHRL